MSDRIGGDSPTASSNEEEVKVGRYTLSDHAMTSESADWSKTRLSLEKPYKDANGVSLKKLVEISYDEEFIYEPPKAVDEQLGTRLQRVFDERGNAIWDEYDPQWAESTGAIPEVPSSDEDDEEEEEEDEEQQEVKKKPMNVEELAKLRSKVVPTLMQGSPFEYLTSP